MKGGRGIDPKILIECGANKRISAEEDRQTKLRSAEGSKGRALWARAKRGGRGG